MSIFCSKGWPSFQKIPNFLKLSPGQWSATGHSTDHWAALFWRGGCDCCSRAGGRPHGDGLGILTVRGDTGNLPCAYQASSRSLLTVKVGLQPGGMGPKSPPIGAWEGGSQTSFWELWFGIIFNLLSGSLWQLNIAMENCQSRDDLLHL